MSRASAMLIAVALLMTACVDTAEPTGPAPSPPGDEGELTSAVVTEGAAADSLGQSTRPRSTGYR